MPARADSVLGIDASNIRAGGGLTHLAQLLRAADPVAHGFSRVIVWSGKHTLSSIEDRPWLVKSHQPPLDGGLIQRSVWQRFELSAKARAAGCTLLFIPGGSYAGSFSPVVSFSQNLLPFQWTEAKRFGWSLSTIRFGLLRITQSRAFRRAQGVIFLTRYARDVVMAVIRKTAGTTTIIPHGIDPRFLCPPRAQRAISEYSAERPFRILYVSQVNAYKHQWHVATAVAQLRAEGLPVALELIGPAYPPSLKRLNATLQRLDPNGTFISYLGAVPYEALTTHYREADLFVFASSCETFGQILTEAMSAGLPIACSSQPALQELLGDGGAYFEPENPADIARALRELIIAADIRTVRARRAFEESTKYSWHRCAEETFAFLAQALRAPTQV